MNNLKNLLVYIVDYLNENLKNLRFFNYFINDNAFFSLKQLYYPKFLVLFHIYH